MAHKSRQSHTKASGSAAIPLTAEIPDPQSDALSDTSDVEEFLNPDLKKRRTSSVSSLSSMFSLHQEPLPPPDQKEILAFTSDERHLSFVRNLHMADCITMLNGFSGFYAIISCLRFELNHDESYIKRAVFFSFMGGFFDFFDGKVARLRHKASLIGQELDSLADLISFGVSPTCIAFCMGLQSTADVLSMAFCVLCGLGRLARFNVTVVNIPKDQTGKSKYFEGFPIPTTLFMVLIMLILVFSGHYGENIPGGLLFSGASYEWHPISAFFLFQGCMMISKSIHIPKP
ncbi:CDP-diacylglycerol-serine O-phosphatidyltransferase [Brettanomyces bruxellensis]|uniref:CDP-diacylglycerol--serine O-phosphatidyltransferase n=1 Tax=Dekkera bruxellensis TaxID=5007 RepID=A0A871R9C3_DEKBR|nr:CDP-diacylglycerol-serine O-phosphatidyltransferase [Brettanomyces bruxellensis]QOU18720.1 CDP-diacylglycerol-serine O-phosphatidyltransferase [Brettanomyces bruxellensis]